MKDAIAIQSSPVVILTGASDGIGAACARALARQGANLVLNARSLERLQALQLPQCRLVPGDVTLAATRERLVQEALARFGRIDILINNAGAGIYWPPSLSPGLESRAVFDLNFFAPVALAQLAVPHMRVQRSGVIVNVCSIAGKVTLPWMAMYSASKSALSTMTDGLRMELAGDGIHAMSVYPGYVQTEFQKHALGENPPAAIVSGRRFAITPEQCAADILRGIARRSRSVVTPRWGWAFMAANWVAPGVVEARLNRMNGGVALSGGARQV